MKKQIQLKKVVKDNYNWFLCLITLCIIIGNAVVVIKYWILETQSVIAFIMSIINMFTIFSLIYLIYELYQDREIYYEVIK